MKLSNNIVPLDQLLRGLPKNQPNVAPKIQSGSQITLCPSLTAKADQLTPEEREQLFWKLSRKTSIPRNQT